MEVKHHLHYVNKAGTLQEGIGITDSLCRDLQFIAKNYLVESIQVTVNELRHDSYQLTAQDRLPKLAAGNMMTDIDYQHWMIRLCEALMKMDHHPIREDIWNIIQDRFSLADYTHAYTKSIYNEYDPDKMMILSYLDMNQRFEKHKVPYQFEECYTEYEHSTDPEKITPPRFLGYGLIPYRQPKKQFINPPRLLMGFRGPFNFRKG